MVDSSSLAKYILREEGWEDVRKHLAGEAYSLTLALAEVSNAIWKHHAVHGRVSGSEASVMLEALKKMRDVVHFEPTEDYLSDAFEIAVKERIPVYDALYLAQAKRLGSLLTSDRRQGEVGAKLGIEVKHV